MQPKRSYLYPGAIERFVAPLIQCVFFATRVSLVASLVAGVVFSLTTIARAQETLVYADYPPMMMGADAPQSELGYSVDIVKEAARRLGRNVSVQFYPFRRAIKTVRHSETAIQVSIFRNSTREPHYRWLAMTHFEEMVFLTLSKPIDRLEEARGLERIGVERGSGLDNFLTAAGFENLERVDRPSVNAEKLAAGRIDAWALTNSVAHWTWSRMGFEQKLVSGRPLRRAEVYVATGLNFPAHLAELYAKELARMRDEGVVEQIIEQYVQSGAE